MSLDEEIRAAERRLNFLYKRAGLLTLFRPIIRLTSDIELPIEPIEDEELFFLFYNNPFNAKIIAVDGASISLGISSTVPNGFVRPSSQGICFLRLSPLFKDGLKIWFSTGLSGAWCLDC